MKTEKQVREEMRNTEAGRLLVRYGFEPYDTESSARRIAERFATDLKTVLDALQKASDHLEYCGYGDSWEREGTGPLRQEIAYALALANIKH